MNEIREMIMGLTHTQRDILTDVISDGMEYGGEGCKYEDWEAVCKIVDVVKEMIREAEVLKGRPSTRWARKADQQ